MFVVAENSMRVPLKIPVIEPNWRFTCCVTNTMDSEVGSW